MQKLSRSGSLCKLSRVFNQSANTITERTEPFIPGLPSLPAQINLLNDYRQFEIGKDHVKIERRKVATALLSVDFHEIFAPNEARHRRHRWQDCPQFFGIICIHPVAQGSSKVKERVTDSCHLPIKYCRCSGEVIRIQQHIVQLEIVMNERCCRALRHMFCQPAGESLNLRYIVCLGSEVTLDPALNLAREETVGMPEFAESCC